MKIGHIDLDSDILVIAEIGNNHEGDIHRAEEMISQAAQAGAQAVKFQSIVPERLVAADQTARLAQLKRFQLSRDTHVHLAAKARDAGVMFLSTPFALEMVDLLAELSPAIKIASGDNNFSPLLEKAAQTGKPIILSTGMATLQEIADSKATIEKVWTAAGQAPGLAVLHCVSAYPTPAHDANLRGIAALAQLGCTVGYSDHTLGLDAAIAAIGLGARIIEKHFTLSKNQSDFRDHALSVEPAELKQLVERAQATNLMLGNGIKRIMPSEEASAVAARRSICSSHNLPAGHLVTLADLDWLRPAGGLAPERTSEILGRRLRRDVRGGEQLAPDMFD